MWNISRSTTLALGCYDFNHRLQVLQTKGHSFQTSFSLRLGEKVVFFTLSIPHVRADDSKSHIFSREIKSQNDYWFFFWQIFSKIEIATSKVAMKTGSPIIYQWLCLHLFHTKAWESITDLLQVPSPTDEFSHRWPTR